MSVAAISDIHGRLHDLNTADFAGADLVLLAGDIVPLDTQRVVDRSLAWLHGEFAAWLDEMPPEAPVVLVAGNHDFALATIGAGEPGVHRGLFGCRQLIYVQDASVEVCGLSLYGTPWIPFLSGGWAFTAPSSFGGRFLAEKFSAIPEGLDILLTHTPMRGYLDRDVDSLPATPRDRPPHLGSGALLRAVQTRRPRLHVCGHVHEGRGATGIRVGESWRDWTVIANVTSLDGRYEPTSRHTHPMSFLVPYDRRQPVEVIGK